MINSIEIFSGAGGLAKGLEMAGIRHNAFVEWNADACDTLRSNYDPSLVYEGDIRNFDFAMYSGINIIAGGPPCQPFSLGGKAQGSNDERDMFPSAISAIRALRPQAFIFENVKGLLRKSFAEYFRYILLQLSYPDLLLKHDDWRKNLLDLEEVHKTHLVPMGYNVTYNLVNAADYGIPQIRERVVIIGFRSDIDVKWTFPKPTHSKDALLWAKFVSNEYWDKHGVKSSMSEEFSEKTRKSLMDKYGMFEPSTKPWVTVRDALCSLGEPNNVGDHILRNGAKEYPGHTGSNIDEPSKTIKAGSHGVPGGENMIKYPDGHVRYYTVAEAKRIQTFPDDYVIKGTWTEAMRQLGNAVPVELAKIVAKTVVDALSNSEKVMN